ncbi:MAG: hypothetical protein IJJ59_05770 [Pseudobutyrivibrio sp.]|uniref:hypothetical protein n=1 Tax=Pseudobutyrivibrio sp. TaxID=2014367 RepID=UPI0025F5A1C2|nr:hypothetical protein [Pseudobutyrivibrio sp.]MBQ6462810.1 hypothetical protein [Pseudobutyrivibrio sp.]
MRKWKKNFKCFLLVGCMLISIYTPSYAKTSGVMLNPKEKHIYEKLETDTIVSDFTSSAKKAKKKYDGKYYIIVDKISEIQKNRKDFTIKNTEKNIECSYDKKLDDNIANGNVRVLFGKINVSTFGKGSISFNINQISKDTSKYKDAKYGLTNGSVINNNQLTSRKLGDGIYKYSILKDWIKYEEPLDNVNGYVYNLNELSGSGYAEKLFVFYIDEHQLEDPTDISKSNKVREAIVKDILLNPKLKMHKKYVPLLDRDVTITDVSDDYLALTNYSGNYKDKNGYKHRVEFLFPEEHDNAYLCFLYIYYKEEFNDDVLMLTKSIK